MSLSPLEAQGETLAFLRQPSTYRHKTHNPALAETNQCWVVLMGDFAYKMFKAAKAARDNTSLDQRRLNALLEIDANQTLAGNLYLGVRVVVRQANGALALVTTPKATDTVLDYVVRMRRFNDADLLYTRLFANGLEPQHLADLGRLLATFHKGQPVSTRDNLTGYTNSLNRQLGATFIPYVQRLESTVDGALMQELTALFKAEMAACRDLVEARPANAYKHLHGDMDFGNIAFYKGRLVPFDAQVLNVALNQDDVMKDVAYVLAPLFMGGRDDLAKPFVDAYFATRTDANGRAVLHLWVGHAAYVRAGSWLSRAHKMPDGDAKETLLARGRAFQQVARRAFTRQLPL